MVWLFEAEGLVGEGVHHPSGVAMGVGFAGELVADLAVALSWSFLPKVVVFADCEVVEFGDRAEGGTASGPPRPQDLASLLS